MVDIDERDIERTGETLGKTYANEQRSHQARTARESYGTEIFLPYARTHYSLVNHRHNILLMSTRSQLWHHASIGFVHLLRSCDIAQQHSILEHSGRGIVATALYT